MYYVMWNANIYQSGIISACGAWSSLLLPARRAAAVLLVLLYKIIVVKFVIRYQILETGKKTQVPAVVAYKCN